MNYLPHIPLLSTVFVGIGCYLLPFVIVLLWLLFDSKKIKMMLISALVMLSLLCMFFEEACCPSREYPWDCMMDCIFRGTLIPVLCLLGYMVYIVLCACLPGSRKTWKGIGFAVLGIMCLGFEYVNVSFPAMLLAGYLFRFVVRRKFPSRIPIVRKCHAVLAMGVVPGICIISVVCAIVFPPPEAFVCEKVKEEMDRDMAVWQYQADLVLLSCRFLEMERGRNSITVKYYCETNMGPAIYRAFCNGYGGYQRAQCTLLRRQSCRP